jgi:hypothetical protein
MKQSAAGALPTRSLTVVYRPIGDLRPDPRNARTHPKRQIEQLCASIREFGFTNPVLIDEQSVLIAGHGRLRAAREIGFARMGDRQLTTEEQRIVIASVQHPEKVSWPGWREARP